VCPCPHPSPQILKLGKRHDGETMEKLVLRYVGAFWALLLTCFSSEFTPGLDLPVVTAAKKEVFTQMPVVTGCYVLARGRSKISGG
jgi:hypothetical protein